METGSTATVATPERAAEAGGRPSLRQSLDLHEDATAGSAFGPGELPEGEESPELPAGAGSPFPPLGAGVAGGSAPYAGPVPAQQHPGAAVLTLSESRIAVTGALNQAAAFTAGLEILASRLAQGSPQRGTVEEARRLAGQSYNALAAAAGLLAVK